MSKRYLSILIIISIALSIGDSRADGGFIRTWLICGEFPNPSQEGRKIGFETDYLTSRGGEAEILPAEGMYVLRPDDTEAEWFTHTSPGDVVDFVPLFKERQASDVVAYACTYIKRAQVGRAFLAVGSDDGIKIWLNGELVHENLVQRGVSKDQDVVEVLFREGDNTLLVKVEQGGGGWGFVLRVVETFLTGEFDLGANQFVFSLRAPGDRLGRIASLIHSGEVLSEAELVKDESGSVTARIGLSAPLPNDSLKTVTIALDGKEVGAQDVRHSGIFAAVELLQQRQSELRERFRTDAPWDDMAAAPPLVRRHRGMVARAFDFLDLEVLPVDGYELDALVDAAEMIRALDGGEDYLGAQRNEFWSAYYSSADGSGQHFVIAVPVDFDPQKSYPLIVALHGLGGRPKPNFDRVHSGQYIEVQPWGRGDTWYAALGDRDVLSVVDYVKQWYRIDSARVYVIGWSMGGRGTWTIASRHPDLFAAAAPFFGWGDGLPLRNLRNVPVFNQHGQKDWVVSVDQSRFSVDILQKLGYSVAHKEYPDAGHGIPDAYPARDWMLTHRRPDSPGGVTYTCQTPDRGRAYWFRIRRFVDPHLSAMISASVSGRGAQQLLTVLADNVEVLELDVSSMPVDRDADLLVQIGQTLLTAKLPLPEQIFAIHLEDKWRLEDQWSLPDIGTRPYRPGAMADLYTGEPLLIVYGSRGDSARTALWRQAAEKLSRHGGVNWREMAIGRIPVRADADLTDEEMSRFNLVLLGGARDNRIAAKMADRLPFTINGKNELIAGEREPVSLDSAVLRLAYYNPLSSERLIFLIATDESGSAAEEYLQSIQDLMTGSWGLERSDQPDLIVESLDGVSRRRMQFTHGWQWHIVDGAERRISEEMASSRQLELAYLRVMRRTCGADFALSSTASPETQVYDPRWYTLADMASARAPAQTLLGSLSGGELIEIHQRWMADGQMISMPSFAPDEIDPERTYRIAISPSLCWELMSRQKNLRDVEAGPEWRQEDLWKEIFGEGEER